ncbi:anthranilate phosphoribosyltransferase-like protein [Arabidopsis thaliana]|uniref:Multiple C2 domain and transmembrane region protein 13 n=1 Tax=Arabidopsis thaliana TaxID=3702 RepID=MCT13_ARATH|nr:Ca2+dependent plant phosphoribosyltransferase family protein [Arabidopsis thaliana]Q9LZE5.1 RecName: Full=Multiple C2 domain and transmembrane region protein 13 [Arabidopsis thaliana]AED90603.1 Ca2+dependent plant phosphoribosyltransferase family protein [Arabidopsis thaliana]CAB83301.1 anthranilate phosphoribosyltransferase-like protein [Arabidopsis thaliana]|eukprot:NP_001318468.1 Ca2+dependent plant phosphoribosyltransferase family protein [Arabidopsis thaliana]
MAANKDEFSVKQISPKLGGERGARNPYGPTSLHDLVEQMEFLYVDVIRAIKNSDVDPGPCDPVVEITLGNYKSSTKDLPVGPNMDWNQVFAFDKTKGDVLSVTLKDRLTNTVINKSNFKLASEIPTRAPPDARIAPQRYPLRNTKTGFYLMMSVWFGTQVDEVYPVAWFSDASEVSTCVINTRPKVYLAPRLCYVRVTIVSGHDLISTDRNRTPSVYVTATLGQVTLKTEVSSGTNPSWNKDLIFVASEPLEGTVYIRLIDRVDDQHEERIIGKLEKKLSEMTPLKVPSSAPALFYDIEVEPAGDSRRFASRLKMKLATDQAYHVAEESIQYSSDYRPFVKGLWPCLLGKLEIGILGATGLKGSDERKQGIDSYVVAKYGNKWARTRTVVNSVTPKWNEQYSWDDYEKCTVLTLGIYDNRQIFKEDQANDVPIGKVRISLNRVESDWIYACSYPILKLGSSGLKKMGELQLAVRFVYVAQGYARYSAPFRWLLPKAHYKSPLSVYQIEEMRAEAVKINCANLARTEPALRNEVVWDMLKPKTNTRYSTCDMRKVAALAFFDLFLYWPSLIVWLAIYLVVVPCIVLVGLSGLHKFLTRKFWNKRENPRSPLIVNDLKLWKLESPNLDELEEEFDSFPSSVSDVNILRMRYDRIRMVCQRPMILLGDAASQGERLYALLTFNGDDQLASFYCWLICVLVALCWYNIPMWLWSLYPIAYWLNFTPLRNDMPCGVSNFFRRLPTNEVLF